MSEIIYKEEAYKIIGCCMEVHNQLGKGFLEIVYKEALEYEFNKLWIPYSREKEYIVNYKGIILPHKFYADFVVYDKIILEIKGVSLLALEHIAQTLNYLESVHKVNVFRDFYPESNFFKIRFEFLP